MDIENPNWSEIASLNQSIPPDAFRSGMAPGDENDTFREIMGAVKREWNRSHPTLTLAVGSNSWGVSPATAVTAYEHGQIITAKFPGSLSVAKLSQPTLAYNGLTGKKVYIIGRNGPEWPIGLTFAFTGMYAFFYYDETLDSGNGGFVIFSPLAKYPKLEMIECPITSESGVVTAGTGKFTFRTPCAFTVTEVRASLQVPQTSGSALTIDVNAAGSTIFIGSLDKLTFNNGEKTTVTASVQPIIGVQSLTLKPPAYNDDTEWTIDVLQIGDGTAKGLKVYILGYPR